ncbi:zinc finger protein 572-like [Cydia fagiglandana]|uniref:zinc finger protein 572-like n=1 Tax=Cydia fagiglandana TaxID=1458189 RepID=UPI002FEDF6B0
MSISLDDVHVNKEEVCVKEEIYDDPYVKREPGLNTAAQNESSDHKVKVKLSETDLNTTQETYCKEEPVTDDGASAAQAELYAGHIVKDELVLGPELLHPLETTTELESLNPSQVTTSQRESDLDSESTFRGDKDSALGKPNNENEYYVCSICSKQFTDKDSCVEHLLKHTGVKFYTCQICGKEFSRKYDFNSHKREHIDRKPPDQPYSCDVCEQEFWQPSLLANHKKTHAVEKPYQCDVCNMKYATKCGLSKHKRKHLLSYKPRDNTVKPFTCEICNNRLTTKYTLAKHKLIHLEEKPFYCSVCGRGFANNGNLTRHKKMHMN